MKKILCILTFLLFDAHLSSASECSPTQIDRGCKTTSRIYCHPKIDDCKTFINCSCFNTTITQTVDTTDNLTSESHSQGGFTGFRCSQPHPKTGDKTCCEYQDGIRVSCSRSI